ncbi:MAG TPA: hypothetical protein VF331_16785 [Polyangiales bacterium]
MTDPLEDPNAAQPARTLGDHARVVVVVDDAESDFADDLADEPMVMTFPHLLVRELVAFLALSVFLVLVSLLFDAPLGPIADPSRTPNPAKAPWYFLGLQELLQYYPPVVAGVLLPALLVIALAVIPYFRVNVERPALWDSAPLPRLGLLWLAIAALSGLFCFTGARPVWALVIPLWIVGVSMSAGALPWLRGTAASWLRTRSLPFWIFVWFLLSAATLTAIGCFFRGPSWSLTLPWRDGIY